MTLEDVTSLPKVLKFVRCQKSISDFEFMDIKAAITAQMGKIPEPQKDACHGVLDELR